MLVVIGSGELLRVKVLLESSSWALLLSSLRGLAHMALSDHCGVDAVVSPWIGSASSNSLVDLSVAGSLRIIESTVSKGDLNRVVGRNTSVWSLNTREEGVLLHVLLWHELRIVSDHLEVVVSEIVPLSL